MVLPVHHTLADGPHMEICQFQLAAETKWKWEEKKNPTKTKKLQEKLLQNELLLEVFGNGSDKQGTEFGYE